MSDRTWDITTKSITVYLVKFGDKQKTFRYKHAIPGWIAKQAMLPIFQQFDDKYGETELEVGDQGQLYKSRVWDHWLERKYYFIRDMNTHGIEYAEKALIDFFKNDYV